MARAWPVMRGLMGLIFSGFSLIAQFIERIISTSTVTTSWFFVYWLSTASSSSGSWGWGLKVVCADLQFWSSDCPLQATISNRHGPWQETLESSQGPRDCHSSVWLHLHSDFHWTWWGESLFLQYFLMFFVQREFPLGYTIFQSFRAIFLSTTGLVITLPYCYCNSEVRRALTTRYFSRTSNTVLCFRQIDKVVFMMTMSLVGRPTNHQNT